MGSSLRRREARFFDRIVYSSSNEDGASERTALGLQQGDSALAVLGSGARAFELLLGPAQEVVGVDLNVHQCALAHLKVAAYSLDYQDFQVFLGLVDGGGSERLRLYRARVRPNLTEAWRVYWDEHEALVAAGVIYSGTWESYFRWFARAAKSKSAALSALFAAPDLETQREVWRTRWCDRRWRAALWAFGRRATWKYVLREPGIERIDPSFDIAAHFAELFDRCADRHLFRETPYLHLLFYGRYNPEGPFPDHLSEAGHRVIASRLDRLEIVHTHLSEYLEASPARFDGFSLSDVSSYASPDDHVRIWKGVRHAARPGARVCERYFLAEGAGEAVDGGHLVRNSALEAQLEAADNTFIYRFRCGIVGA